MHVGLLVGGLALFLVTRAAVVRLRTGHRGLSLHPAEVAYLVAGPEHALLVAGVDLHDAGLLRPVSRPEGARMTREQVLQLAPSGVVVVVSFAVVVVVLWSGAPPSGREEGGHSGVRRGARRKAPPSGGSRLRRPDVDAIAWRTPGGTARGHGQAAKPSSGRDAEAIARDDESARTP
jgi:hypothetical protein